MRPFQIGLLVGFGLIAVIGLFVFSTYKSSSDTASDIVAGGITIWGTLPSSVFSQVISEVTATDDRFNQVSYVQKDPRTFDLDLLKAAANGAVPDLIVAPSEYLYMWMPRLYSLPYTSFPKRTFQDTYIDGAEIFMGVEGVYALPFAVDPLVLYWNRDLFTTAGFVNPPTTYEDMLRTYIPALKKVDTGLRITQGAIALGDFANIPDAKDILALFTLQAGSNIVQQREDGGYRVTFADQGLAGSVIPGVAALQFFHQFADPTSSFYTWSRALPNDTDIFIANQLAMRFGFASEYAGLRARNPNLNFDVAAVPQNAGATVKRTYGMFYGFAIPKQAKNPNGSVFVASTLTGTAVAASLAQKLQMAPVQRATLAQGSGDVAESVRFGAAITARGWLDPNPVESRSVFADVLEKIATGRARVNEAASDAANRIQALY